jgi:hypothetical protein
MTTKTKGKSKIISTVLSPAIKFWLRSQVEQVEGLDMKVIGSDGQILRGHIPEVFLEAQSAIYQGLSLSQVQVRGENIKINLGQIIKGKALRLLEPIFINGQITLKQKDLQASLTSSLLGSGLRDLLLLLLASQKVNDPEAMLRNYDITWQEVTFHEDKVSLKGMIKDDQENVDPIHLRTGLSLINQQILSLNPLHVETSLEHLNFSLTDFQVDLGQEVEIQQLILDSQQLCCHGKLTVQPDLE